MTWGVVMDVAAPVETYDAMHRELLSTIDTEVDGLLVHLTRPTATGFQVIEVWESQEAFDHYTRELVAPAMAKVVGKGGPPQMRTEEFEVRGMVLPRGGLVR